ncbi:hypothetical protein MHM582_3374 [Microbacterium sp. HM58-2]|nr:hypothetical protein MHM582_3374 [Microbacterium sp. HM58-2]
MSDQSPPPAAAAPKKAWYLKWWVWAVAAALMVGGVGALTNQGGDVGAPGTPDARETAAAEPTASAEPTEIAPLDLTAFLTESGVTFENARISARKAYIYVPSATTNEQAQQIANTAMQYICDHAAKAGDEAPAANRVEVSDSVSPASPGYDAAKHPSGYATDELCEG